MSDEPIIIKERRRHHGMAYKHPDIVRQRIQTSALLNRLAKCARGEITLTTVQVRSIEILLRKTLPDLSSVEHTGTIQHRHVTEMSDAELLAVAAGGRPGATEAEGRAVIN